MKKVLLGLVVSLGTSTTLYADQATDWGYEANNAPEKWASLSEKYHACSGLNQSPIDIKNTTSAKLEPLKFNYAATAKSIVNNGHTVQVDFNAGNTLTLDGQEFVLKQFHLHSPSENKINGVSYPMEMHLVHANAQGELAVVAVMYQKGQLNQSLAQIWSNLPKQAGQSFMFTGNLDAASFLPKKLDYYRFNGSLTTPPCTEGVRWIVLKDIQSASEAQFDEFNKLLAHPNNRPVQPVNARIVLE
ncbi:carbonic anhydrase [Acinetobacter sp. CFCC 10889]|uniref:carbonic anhydrase n=1 Tax=Acinetobacter sp. CFCC 10889 TaxID=1775557 RepID=UPI003A4D37B3